MTAELGGVMGALVECWETRADEYPDKSLVVILPDSEYGDLSVATIDMIVALPYIAAAERIVERTLFRGNAWRFTFKPFSEVKTEDRPQITEAQRRIFDAIKKARGTAA